jgi:ceramide glucosyltransferase
MIHDIVRVIEIVAVMCTISSAVYYLVCLWSALVFLRRQKESQSGPFSFSPPISILKPLKGMDPEIYETFRSHCVQDYTEYEIIFGVQDAKDPVCECVRRLQCEFPNRAIKLVICEKILGANVKVSNLVQMLAEARYGHLIVNDSDIRVERDYLRRVVAPLCEPQVGLVTCLYRSITGGSMGSRLESLGISTDFCPSVLAARLLEGIHFGLGSTLVFQRANLEKIGGFISLVDQLADDYELGKRISDLGLRVGLSEVIVETFLPAYDLGGFLAHQLRWARGVRDSRWGGYLGLVFTFGLFWSLVTLVVSRGALWACGIFSAALLLRLAVAMFVGRTVLKDQRVVKDAWLIPLRDLIAVGVWIASLFGNTVSWRGDRFRLKNGKLIHLSL